MKGTSPAGARGEQEAARWVRTMFGRVAPTYDFLNHLLSLNVDRWWRARTARRVREILRRPEARVLDICCGTGDLVLALERERGAPVMGSDFCRPMLESAAAKIARFGRGSPLFEADAMRLPLRAGSLDLITAAFGFRNLVNYRGGLAEMRRVLKPGGVAAILEFSTPPNAVLRGIYNFYSAHVLPRLGGIVSGSRDAYDYLPESVRKFPGAEELAAEMRAAGFGEVEFKRMTGGIVALHVGTVS